MTPSALPHDRGRSVLTEIELLAWLCQAAPGDRLTYHRGLLALDRIRQGAGFVDRAAAELGRVAGRAWWAAEIGLVHLVQRRHGPDDYSYLIVARSHLPCAAASLAALLNTYTPLKRRSSRKEPSSMSFEHPMDTIVIPALGASRYVVVAGGC